MSTGILYVSLLYYAGISCIFKMTKIPLLYRDKNFSYNALPLVIWAFLEPAVTIMAASIPVIHANRGNNKNDNNASNRDIDIDIDLVHHDGLHIDDRATVPSTKGRVWGVITY
ncbi:hypothetical protein MYCTH_2123458 [Thermothelomyces thermophilus ATCC 42464]|uniref:Uncharacterized protein n=1 Tax=Thermothelomyces thermophilus (strain ATCC 42464 / BCRC 31852 / DSM 1799) TaxID=573729 RepID=G2Q517_THET4|nr:uncharacterized protein MYCTH_2123458 [Thermothelomyces thermophilus ATCC 42464]AEO54555.1 hypothetical protein MYCTH_2123458 [Thermothelomyces thermophilus ATCC 42464]